jgi:uncharacterized protein (DUF305 family)
MRRLIVLLAAVALVAAGCGGNDEGAAPAGEETIATGQVPFDRAFLDAMVPHHRAAIEMAREALDAGLTQPDLINIADSIMTAQQIESDQLLEWREQWFGSREPGSEEDALETLGLSAAEAGMEHGAMDLSMAEDVDQAFAEMMIDHHEGAIRMARLAEDKAGHDEIKKLAGEIIAAQQLDAVRTASTAASGRRPCGTEQSHSVAGSRLSCVAGIVSASSLRSHQQARLPMTDRLQRRSAAAAELLRCAYERAAHHDE